MKTLTETILKKRNEWLEKKKVKEIRGINRGPCIKFSEEVVNAFGKEVVFLNNHDLIENEESWYEIEDDVVWSEEKIKRYGGILEGKMTVELINKKVLGFHQWMYFEGKHYDAECPEGVENFLELPFFKYSFEKQEEVVEQGLPTFMKVLMKVAKTQHI